MAKKEAKRKLKLNKDQIIEIEWLDANFTAEWCSESFAGKQELSKCKSVGYFLNKTNKAIRISASINDGAERDIQVIPQSCVIEIRELK